jgi:DNA-directed RNA polymerase subunit omega
MARITTEDCQKTISNRYTMTMAAAARARQISQGSPVMVEAKDDKPTVIALRELAAGKYGEEVLK